MSPVLPVIVLGFAVAAAAMLGAYWAARGRGEGQARPVLDAIDRARTSLATEMRSGDNALQGAVTQNITALGGQLNNQLGQSRQEMGTALSGFGDRMQGSLEQARKEQGDSLTSATNSLVQALDAQARRLGDIGTTLEKQLGLIRESQAQSAKELGETVASKLEGVRKDNEAQLEKIRATVDEKLQTTLENRLSESFKQVSERLEQVHKGLGEMQVLAEGVGDLKRVLTNVKCRGSLGEAQLEALLQDFLTVEQYEKNAAPVPGSRERVEFAIRLPGRENGRPVLLPIDAKFPIEDYQRLQQAYDDADGAAIQRARAALRVRALGEAQSISAKYVCPPHTTDFGILFLPSEGLFAEMLRIEGLHEELQRKHHVLIAGPTTLQALLGSLRMGFQTLAIEKRSSEVWSVLRAVKTEFGKFGDSLSAVSKKLQEAQNKIDDAAKRSRAVESKLGTVHTLPGDEAAGLLPAGGNGDGQEAHIEELALV